ncbi:MAG: glycosyltransferase family 39 protein [Acidobacteriota bacterium]|nr:glycosyltransferase family 39 protein [Acidobacteriota bacterium]
MRKRLDLRTLLIAAVFLRVVVYVVLGPTGSDHHYEVIESILRDGRLPLAEQYAQAFHPPAYYLLSLPWAMLGGDRFVEVFSLLLSILNLWLLFTLISSATFIQDERARWHGLALTAFLPHLVIYSILVSNDTLAMVAGTLALLAALRFHSDPRLSNAALAGLVAALGLLTKGTLIAQAGVLLFVVAVVSWQRLPVRRAAACVAIFLALTVSLGSYKFIENQGRYGRPIVHNMDFGQDWVEAQRPTIVGVQSLIDVNIVTLLREPYAELRQGGWTNLQSVPLLLYATFWHPYVPVSNFRGTWEKVPVIAQATYLLAIPATLMIVAGWLAAARRPLVWIPLAFFAANLAIVIAAGVKYDAWSCFQSRLLFPSFPAIAFGYAWGIETTDRRWPAMTRFVDMTCVALYAAFLTYFTFEIVSVVIRTLG